MQGEQTLPGLCGSRKHPYPPSEDRVIVWRFQMGGKTQKPIFLKGNSEPKLEFPEGFGGGGGEE